MIIIQSNDSKYQLYGLDAKFMKILRNYDGEL